MRVSDSFYTRIMAALDEAHSIDTQGNIFESFGKSSGIILLDINGAIPLGQPMSAEAQFEQINTSLGGLLMSPKNRVEVSSGDLADESEKITTIDSGKVYQHGLILVEFVRDSNGRITYDGNGDPIIATDDDGNSKIGCVMLQWVQDLFGTGKHGFRGSGFALHRHIQELSGRDCVGHSCSTPGGDESFDPANTNFSLLIQEE